MDVQVVAPARHLAADVEDARGGGGAGLAVPDGGIVEDAGGGQRGLGEADSSDVVARGGEDVGEAVGDGLEELRGARRGSGGREAGDAKSLITGREGRGGGEGDDGSGAGAWPVVSWGERARGAQAAVSDGFSGRARLALLSREGRVGRVDGG